MPQWLPTPPTPDDAVPYRLIRVPATGVVAGIVTCTDLVGCNTHYLHNRTTPCDGPGQCDACAEGYAYRWHCYASLLLTPGWEHVILELTAAASDPLRNYADHHGGPHGCRIRARRPSGRPNGRIVLECTPADLTGVRIPDPPNIQRILCHIWGVKYDAPDNRISTRIGAIDAQVSPQKGDGRYKPRPSAK